MIAVDFPQFTDGRGYSIGRAAARSPWLHAASFAPSATCCATSCSRLPNAASTRSLIRADRDAAAALAGLRRLRPHLRVDVAHAAAVVSPAQTSAAAFGSSDRARRQSRSCRHSHRFRRRVRLPRRRRLGAVSSGRRVAFGGLRPPRRREPFATAGYCRRVPDAAPFVQPSPACASAIGSRRRSRALPRHRREIFRTAFACRDAKARPRPPPCSSRSSIAREGLQVLLTQRSADLPDHRGSDQLSRRPRRARRRFARRRGAARGGRGSRIAGTAGHAAGPSRRSTKR